MVVLVLVVVVLVVVVVGMGNVEVATSLLQLEYAGRVSLSARILN